MVRRSDDLPQIIFGRPRLGGQRGDLIGVDDFHSGGSSHHHIAIILTKDRI
jgi:hypothetical protein